jgi:hypothetical protein
MRIAHYGNMPIMGAETLPWNAFVHIFPPAERDFFDVLPN